MTKEGLPITDNKNSFPNQQKTYSANIFCDVARLVVDLPQEMFNDALFFREQITLLSTNQHFAKFRYTRAAIIFFCCALEGYINQLLVEKLKEKQEHSTLSSPDQKLLTALIDPNFIISISINKKIKEHLPRLFKIQPAKEIEQRCINLTFCRNEIVHYSQKEFEKVYSNKAEQFVLNAPDIIKSFIGMYSAVPHYFNKTHSEKFDRY